MKRFNKVISILIALCISVGLAYAFVLIQPPIKWQQDSLPHEILVSDEGHGSVSDGDGGVTEIIDAISAQWNGAVPDPDSDLVTMTRYSDPPLVIGDGISVMGFNVVGTGCTGGCLGITLITPPSESTETVNGIVFNLMTDADIFFNPRAKFYSDSEPGGCRREFHIESVAVHEVGHLLGLDHTPVVGATMFASTGRCNAGGETLAQDDIDGVNCIYNNGYGCGACVADTLIVDQTNCDQPSNGPNAGDFVVETFIVDNCGNSVAGADVSIDVPTSPLGTLTCDGQTSSTGRLGCALDNPPAGNYETLVGDVSKASFNTWSNSECGGVGQPPCGCSIEIGGGSGDCGNGTCDVGESCDGRNGTESCTADCPGKTNGRPSGRFCYVDEVCLGPGCP